MATQTRNDPGDAPLVETVQEGSRWRHNRPTGEAVAEWFKGNVKLHHPELEHSHYVQGITLIPANEKIKRSYQKPGGGAVQVEAWEQVFTPYAKVETRLAYFWDYMLLHPEWVGVIEPVELPRVPFDNPAGQGYSNPHLPPGFFRLPVKQADERWVEFFGCSQQVVVYDRNDSRIRDFEDPVTGEPRQRIIGKPIMQAAPGNKLVAALDKDGKADPFAIMKAETGAGGRALGMAGMLVLPGSGVATAEDMQEALAAGGGQGAAVGALDAQLPEDQAAQAPADSDDAVRERIKRLSDELIGISGDKYQEFASWAGERKIDLTDLKSEQLRSCLRQLEKKIAEASDQP